MSAIGSPKSVADVVDRPRRVLDDVVQEGEELRAARRSRPGQDVGDRLRVRQALARAHADAVVGVGQKGDRLGAKGAG